MSAVVIDFAAAVALRRKPGEARRATVQKAAEAALTHDFTFWSGASGARYVHTVFALLECPEMPNANIVLARRLPSGRLDVMHVGRVEHDAPSLNLAEIRQTAATLGANEVHVHLLAANAAARCLIERDLSGADDLQPGGRASGF